jgi:hypothetical protein
MHAEIYVDGRRIGFAPRLFPLSVGSHRVELRTEAGETLSRSIVVETRNTRSAAATWIVPAAD